MKDFIHKRLKEVLNELFLTQKLIQEAEIDAHFKKRLIDRITNPSEVPVGYEYERGEYKVVGVYPIPKEVKDKALFAYNKIEQINFPKNQDLAIKVADVIINPNLVKYNQGFDRNELKGKNPLVLIDKITNSNGNIIYAIIRANKAITLFFAKSYVPQTPDKMRVNVIIKDINNYRPR